MNQTILWKRIDWPGHEACSLYQAGAEWRLEGMAVFLSDDGPCRLSYAISCDSSWNTLRGTVSGWVGNDNIEIEISRDANHCWQLNGSESSAVSGCIDLDLNFSPATNLLPIRRLNLEIGQEAEVRAAWLRFPSFELEPLAQIYTRLNEFTYRYSSTGGTFVRDLAINEAGLVTDYPGFWQAERV
jgi:uncharacterized protein